MKNPNLFIVGAPKSGTTFLYHYLKKHSDIYFPDFKEPHFFGSDLQRRNGAYNLSLNEYQSLFKTDKKIIGEASTFYLFSDKAAKEIHDFNPKAKIIIMLRDLVDLVHSLHSQFVFSGDEVIEDFSHALALENNRLSGQNIPKQTTVVNKLFYTSNILSLPKNIQSFIDRFGRENIKFIDLKEIKKNPERVYSETLEFLNIDSSFNAPKFKVINKNKTYKSKTMRNFIKKYSIFLGNLRSKLFKKPLGIIKILESLNKSENDRVSMSDDLYKKLSDQFYKVDLQIKNIINNT
ncbi:MAG: hypothetical protein CBB66_06295 [bacterium TMED6]|nr:MAG: hypothetical protein CBB66_06295 [bacterium TMED6]